MSLPTFGARVGLDISKTVGTRGESTQTFGSNLCQIVIAQLSDSEVTME